MSELGGDVGVAEAVEAARLHEPLGDVEDPLAVSGVAVAAAAIVERSASCLLEV